MSSIKKQFVICYLLIASTEPSCFPSEKHCRRGEPEPAPLCAGREAEADAQPVGTSGGFINVTPAWIDRARRDGSTHPPAVERPRQTSCESAAKSKKRSGTLGNQLRHPLLGVALMGCMDLPTGQSRAKLSRELLAVPWRAVGEDREGQLLFPASSCAASCDEHHRGKPFPAAVWRPFGGSPSLGKWGPSQGQGRGQPDLT